MRIPTSHQSGRPTENSSMTPMIDVVFLLLIFFVCASVGQLRELLLPTDLAAGSIESATPVDQPKPLGEVWLHLERRNGNETVIKLNDREYTDFGELQTTLRELAEIASEIPVILDTEPDVPMGDMIRVYDTCRAANFDTIQFAVESPGSTPNAPR